MNIIYPPTGRAKEYAGLAANIYKGCTHGCIYCYCPSATFQSKENFYESANPKKEVIKRLEKDCQKLNSDCPEILLSFIGDPYQHAELDLGLTRNAIKIFIDYDLPFSTLSKGGTRAVRDFDLLEDYDKARFGTTLVLFNQKDADEWEPNAASIKDRIRAIEEAHRIGIQTWVSLEPVIFPEQALKIIRELYPIVGHWKVGKINYHKTDVDWIEFREQLKDLFELVNADYYIKKSLTEL